MGGGDINVAFHGTFGDLASSGEADMFDTTFDFELMDHANTDHAFSAINARASYGGATISPKDLLNDSMPPSTSFTNLSTPGSTFLETPADDYQTSPLFSDAMDAFNYPSLFPEDGDNAAAVKMERTPSHQVIVHPGGESNHKRSSNISVPQSSMSPAVRHSSVAGVGARKRDKPLPPIIVDHDDTVALKRARNTAAARKSRAKKMEEREGLEGEITILQAQISELQADRDYWKNKALGNSMNEAAE